MISQGDTPVVCFDVDDTLILWGPIDEAQKGDKNVITFKDHAGLEFMCKFNQAHVDAIKTHKSRGHYVIVWSAGGGEWAKRAVEVLKLTEYVDETMSKPSWYYDDLPVNMWMGSPIFLEE